MAESAEGTAVQTDPLEADPWAHRRRPPSRERPAQSSASSWGAWVPIQLQTFVSLGASTVATLDTATTSALERAPSARQRSREPAVRKDIQEILRSAVAALLEERRRQSTGVTPPRPLPHIPQLLQTLRGMPGAAIVTPAPPTSDLAPAGIPWMVRPPTRVPLPEPGRVNTARTPPPNLSAILFGVSQTPALTGSVANPGAVVGVVAASSWAGPVQSVAREAVSRGTKGLNGVSAGCSICTVLGSTGPRHTQRPRPRAGRWPHSNVRGKHGSSSLGTAGERAWTVASAQRISH